jgi:hypothetical protein
MYFDLHEIARRKFEVQCRLQQLNTERLAAIYHETQQELELLLNEFLTQADRGQNRKAMLKWNAFIVEQLGIDNVALFSLYE